MNIKKPILKYPLTFQNMNEGPIHHLAPINLLQCLVDASKLNQCIPYSRARKQTWTFFPLSWLLCTHFRWRWKTKNIIGLLSAGNEDEAIQYNNYIPQVHPRYSSPVESSHPMDFLAAQLTRHTFLYFSFTDDDSAIRQLEDVENFSRLQIHASSKYQQTKWKYPLTFLCLVIPCKLQKIHRQDPDPLHSHHQCWS